MLMILRMLLIPVALLALAACGANKALKPEDQAAIESLSVAADVKLTNEPMVIGSEAGVAMLFGIAGSMAAANAQQSAAQKFSEFLKASGIDVGTIARLKFIERLRDDPRFGPRLSEDGSYRFELEVPAYGINKTNAFSSKWVANVRIDCKLVAPDGRIVAQDWAVTMPFAERIEFTAEEMQANPQLLQKAFEEAAAGVSAKLLKQ